MMKPPTINHLWQQFALAAELDLPTAGIVQRLEMRKAFYAGATAMLGTMQRLQAGGLPPAEGAKVLIAWTDELREFRSGLNGKT